MSDGKNKKIITFVAMWRIRCKSHISSKMKKTMIIIYDKSTNRRRYVLFFSKNDDING